MLQRMKTSRCSDVPLLILSTHEKRPGGSLPAQETTTGLEADADAELHLPHEGRVAIRYRAGKRSPGCGTTRV